MWTHETARSRASTNTKFFALQVMDGVIKYRYVPDDQREGIKNFISNLIIARRMRARSGATARSSKINNVLVQILKHDWPKRWSSFVPRPRGRRSRASRCAPTA